MAEPISIFCLVDEPDRVPDMIRQRYPDARITVCTHYDDVPDAVKAADPEIAFTMVFAAAPSRANRCWLLPTCAGFMSRARASTISLPGTTNASR